MTRVGIIAGAGLLLAAALVSWVGAIESVNLEQAGSEEFGEGTFEDVAVNNLGELKLTRQLDVLLKGDKDVVFVNSVIPDGHGNFFAATAPNGKLFRIAADGKCDLWYTAKEKTLQSLAVGPKGELYVGTGGGEGRIYRVTAKNDAKLVFEKEGLAYVWSMTVLPDGKSIIAGTGPAAELIQVATDGEKATAGEVLYKPEKEKQKNVLAVVADPAGKMVYFSTDTDGLVFKFDLAAKKPFLLYNAEESEVSCLALAADGVLYAGTSDPKFGGEFPGGRDEGGKEGLDSRGHGDGPGGPSGGLDDEGSPSKDDEESDQPPAKAADKSAAPAHDSSPAKGGSPKAEPKSDGAKPPADLAKPGQPAQPVHPSPAARPSSQPDEKDKLARSSTSQPASRSGHGDTPPPSMTIRSLRGPSHGPSGHAGLGGDGGGNAVYRIDPQGFVTEVVRQPTMMLALMLQGSKLIVATGGADGRVIAVTPGVDEVATLAKPKEVKQVLSLAAGKEGTILIGTANDAIIARVGAGFAAKGQFTSKPVDAKAVARWGVISERSEGAAGSVKVQVRSGNLAEPDDALWSAWSEPIAASKPVAISAPAARFLQYRLVLTSDKADVTPVVKAVTLSYVNENQAPKIASVKVTAPGSGSGSGGGGVFGESSGPAMRGGSGSSSRGGPSGMSMNSSMSKNSGSRMSSSSSSSRMSGGPTRFGGGGEEAGGGVISISWAASDPNDDTMEFTLYFRKVGSKVWVPMFDKPLREENTAWPTRGLPDGEYQVKVVASDQPSNPVGSAKEDSRISDLFVVDNTPPVIAEIREDERKGNKVTFSVEVTDALSRLASARVKVDQVADEGQVVLPTDGLWDTKSKTLRFTVDLTDKPGGGHVIILNVTDAAGNVASASKEVAK
jgi:hypothetical protein